MTALSVQKYKCEKCGKVWKGAFPLYYFVARGFMTLFCNKCGKEIDKEFLKNKQAKKISGFREIGTGRLIKIDTSKWL